MTSVLQQLNADLAGLVTGVQRSVVQVRDDQRGGAGAGTIWHPDGLIVTNAHVARRDHLQVALSDGRVLPARLIARDDERDLAALMVEADNLPTIEPGNSAALHPGQWVLAVGHPWGITNAATGGVVIGTGKQIADLPVRTANQDWVVVDVLLRPGNSGGPLVDAQGRMVGVNTMINGPEVGVAVAVNAVKEFLRRTLGSDDAARTPESASPEFV
ncbi:MAG: trypsin-like serine protease [Chloroflexi bacterium]|nr:trypsin-like serine protease [Chloroflexota bacterium]